MDRNTNLPFLRRKKPGPRIPWRWKLYLVISTAIFLGMAAFIAIWLPDYRPTGWALILFSAFHVSFLVVQRVGAEQGDS